MMHATVRDLNPWVDYEFRVVAINSVGVGEPSTPSKHIRTAAAGILQLYSSSPSTSTASISSSSSAKTEELFMLARSDIVPLLKLLFAFFFDSLPMSVSRLRHHRKPGPATTLLFFLFFPNS